MRPRPRAVTRPAALGGLGRSLPGLTAATMSSFSESALEKKLSELSNSQQSVQTLSLWLIHHRKHAGPIVSVWHRELRKGKHPLRPPPALPGAAPGPRSAWRGPWTHSARKPHWARASQGSITTPLACTRQRP